MNEKLLIKYMYEVIVNDFGQFNYLYLQNLANITLLVFVFCIAALIFGVSIKSKFFSISLIFVVVLNLVGAGIYFTQRKEISDIEIEHYIKQAQVHIMQDVSDDAILNIEQNLRNKIKESKESESIKEEIGMAVDDAVSQMKEQQKYIQKHYNEGSERFINEKKTIIQILQSNNNYQSINKLKQEFSNESIQN